MIARIGKQLAKNPVKLVDFLYAIFFDINEVGRYIDFLQNEVLRREMSEMSLVGEHLIEYGRDMEKERAEKAERRAEQERNRAEQAENRAEDLLKKYEEALRKLKELFVKSEY